MYDLKCEKIIKKYLKLKNLKSEFDRAFKHCHRDKSALQKAKMLKQQISELFVNDTIILFDNNGKEIFFDLAKQLDLDSLFYKSQGIEWVDMPSLINLDFLQMQEATKIIRSLCPEGDYEKIQMVVIPKGLTDSGEDYQRLHQKMSEGYKNTHLDESFKRKFEVFSKIKNKDSGPYLLITKSVAEIREDYLFKKTLHKKMFFDPRDPNREFLDGPGGFFEMTGLRGLNPAEYLVLQREYFNRTGKHLDNIFFTYLPEILTTEHGQKKESFRNVIHGNWYESGSFLRFYYEIGTDNKLSLGCRLGGRIKLI